MRAAALAAVVALAAVGLARAGAGTAASTTTTSSNSTPPGRTFIDLVSELPTNLDETATPDTASAQLLPSWSSELVRPAPATPGPNARLPADGAVVPYLATSWQRDANGSYTFELRRGVRGDSGNPFTAADVSWSLERAVARSPVAPFLFALANIDTRHPVTILDSHRVRINVTAPSPFTLSVLASYDSAIYDSVLYRSHASASDPWAQQWGSIHSASFGPYWVAWYLPRREIALGANPGFWRQPYYTRVLIRQVSNPDTRLAYVLAGTATHTRDLNWGDFQTAVNNGGSDGVTASILQTGPGVLAWHLNIAHGPLANPLVRQALKLGVNRIEIANAIYASFDTPSALTIPAAFGQRQPATFDPQQSRSLMRAAGYPDGVTIDIYTNDTQAGGNAATLLGFLRQQMLQIDVFLRITYVNNNDQLLALEQQGALESTIDTATPLMGGAGFLLEEDANTALDPVSPAAQEGYRNASLQPLLDQLRGSSTAPAADTLTQQAATIIDSDSPTVNFVAIPVQNVTRANVTGYAAYTMPVTYYEYLHPTR